MLDLSHIGAMTLWLIKYIVHIMFGFSKAMKAILNKIDLQLVPLLLQLNTQQPPALPSSLQTLVMIPS
jgi:hypothetical protein